MGIDSVSFNPWPRTSICRGAGNTGPLLANHPELDETPLVPKDNTGIYCRSWCPLNPKTHEIVFDLILIVLHWVIALVPIAVFCKVAFVVGREGFRPFVARPS